MLNHMLFMYCGISLAAASLWKMKSNHAYDPPHQLHFTQKLDHFNPTIDTTFQQRYFVSNQFWSGNDGPIFFYTGNEGDIEAFINNTGFMWDIAPVFGAMVIFAEHRYYGKSKPYGDIQPSVNNTLEFGQLTAEQALADYAILITHIKSTTAGATNSPVIVFGGSYGGMLSAWIRIKYPHVVDGAIAASAPVNFFTNHIDCWVYNQVVTKDFQSTSNGDQCVKNIRNAWPLINITAQSTEGLQKLSDIFHTCKTLASGNELTNWIQECWGDIAMVDYPYPANFLIPLPAWPVNATCNFLAAPLEKDALLHGLYEAMNVYANHTGKMDCFNTSIITTSAISNALWSYQACTEMVMPFCTDGIHDMFPPSPWSLEAFSKGCKEQYGVTPRPDWIELNFGGNNLRSASNIVFSNGELDPWHLGGVLRNVSDSVVALVMWGAAHHLDLRHHHPSDPASVVEARTLEMAHIHRWITEKKRATHKVKFN